MAEIKLLEEIKQKAAAKNKTIVLPESHDERVIRAAEILQTNKIAQVITIGKEDEVLASAKNLGINLSGVQIIEPEKSDKFEEFVNLYYEKRKHKGMTIEKAREIMKWDLFFGAMLVDQNIADGFVAGSTAATGDVLKACLQCVGMPEGCSIVSSFFIMIKNEIPIAYSDCAVVPNPDKNQLADIAVTTAANFKKLTGLEPKVAMLSFSTNGSAKHELVDKVIEATKIAKEKRPDFLIDGEMQFDAATVDAIGKKKFPDSKVAGQANVLIFPDLQSGNIGYKIAQRVGGCEAVGPVVQGLKKPLFDLSRGCSVDDIVNTSAISLLMAE